MSPSVRNRVLPVVIVALAVGIRLAYWFSITDHPEFQTPTLDARWFHDQALAIGNGAWTGGDAIFRAPLYPYFLSSIYGITGPDPGVARLVQLLLGGITVALLMVLALRIFDRTTSILTGLLAATYWISIYFEGELLISSILPLLGAILLLGLSRVWTVTVSGGRGAAAAGLLLGLFAAARPNILLFLPVATLFLARRRLRNGILFGAVSLCIVGGLTVRNHLVSGEWTLIASQGGLNFYLGNHPESDGRHAVFPGLVSWRNDDIERLTAARIGHMPKQAELSRYWMNEAIKLVRENPGTFVSGLLRKAAFLAGGYEIGNNRDIESYRDENRLLAFPSPGWSVLIPLALAGSILARRRNRTPWLLESYAVVYGISIILFFVCGRFRVPILPALFPLAAAGLAEFGRRIRSKSPVSSLLLVLFLIAGIAASSADPFHIRLSTSGQEAFHRGNVLARNEQVDQAIAAYEESIELLPQFAGSHHHLGSVLIGSGRIQDGLAHLHEANRLEPLNPKVLVTIADHYRDFGQLSEAEEYYRRTIEVDPYYPDGYFDLGGMLAEQGRTEEAEELLRRGLGLYPGDRVGLFNLGKLLSSTGRSDEAIPILEQASEAEPGSAGGWFELGNAYYQSSRIDQSIGAWKRAAVLDPLHIQSRMNLALALVRSNRTGEAIDALEDVLQIDKGHEGARARLRMLSSYRGEPPPSAPPAAR